VYQIELIKVFFLSQTDVNELFEACAPDSCEDSANTICENNVCICDITNGFVIVEGIRCGKHYVLLLTVYNQFLIVNMSFK